MKKSNTSDMSGITVVEFENAVHSEETYLSSELEDGPPFTVHGVALGNDDITKGKSGIKKKWPAEELEQSADSLEGTNLVIDHENSVHGVVGRVTKSGYKEDTGVVYEAELYDENLAEKIQKGLLEVSVRGLHKDVDDLEEDAESDALIVEEIEFKNLSIVPSGAAPSNTLQMGEHAELSAAELASFADSLSASETELQEIEPGMWVTTGDTNGITISQVQDGEIEVDIYEEQDGQWRSIEQTEMFDVDSLDEWDVDEDDIGPAADSDEEDEESDEEDSDKEENAADGDELVSEDDKVQWDDGAAQGVVVERKTDGCFNERIDGDVEVCAGDDEAAVLIEIVKDGERTGTMVAHKEGTLNEGDFSLAEDDESPPNPPEWEEGDMVQWQVAPSMKGKIVHVPSNQDIVMVEVMQEKDGELTETGFTVSAGYPDLVPMDGSQSPNEADNDESLSASETEESESQSVEENAAVDRGQFVKWRDHDNNWRHGRIIEIDQEGQQMVATLRRFTETSDKLDETERKPIQGLDKWDASFEEETDSVETESVSDDSDNSGDSDATVNDLINVLSSVVENASTSKDVPTEDAEPEHEPMGSMENLFNQFMEDGGSPDSTLADFIDWLNEQEELSHDIEGADDILDDPVAIRRMKENDAAYMAFVWHEDSIGQTVPEKHEDELEETFDDYPKAARENAQMALDAREETDNPNDCGTDVGWKRAEQLANGEAVTREQLGKMSAFARHEQNSEMDDEEGKADCGWMMWKAWGGDEGVDWAQRKLDKIEEEASVEELQDYEMHTPDWSGTTESDWSSPDMEDFDTDDLSEIADHFLIAEGGFPVENFGELKLPVVEPNGDLNVNALAAVKGGRGASAVEGLSSEMEEKIDEWVNETANEEFDRDWGMEEEEMAMDVPEDHRFSSKEDAMNMAEDLGLDGAHQMEFDGETMWVPGESHEDYMDAVSENSKHGDSDDEEEMAERTEVKSEPTQTKTVGGVRVLPGDDLQQGNIGASETDSMTKYKVTNMNEEMKEKLSELSDPVAVEAEELEQLQDKADRFEEMSESLEALRERTDILDEVDRDSVEELRDGDDPVVVESARYEELQSEAEQVKGVYAAQLSEHYDAFDSDELADKFSIEELREKYEDQFGSIEELADSTEAEPQSQDPSEEELEEESESGESEEELADEVAKKQDEIRQKLDIGGD